MDWSNDQDFRDTREFILDNLAGEELTIDELEELIAGTDMDYMTDTGHSMREEIEALENWLQERMDYPDDPDWGPPEPGETDEA